MTIFVPLEPSSEFPAQPTFLLPSSNVRAQLSKAIQAIMKAKRIVIICGAGISVQAGIPDFRSSEGLFQTLKRDNPKEAMTSGKELFDASVFNSENKTTLFYQMIAQLSDLSHAAEPTAFHNVLRALDNRGRLLRVYTQNIDAIEQKSGLSFGVPDFDCKRPKAKLKGKPRVIDVGGLIPDVVNPKKPLPVGRLPSPPADTPRCIPLHGTLQSLHCQVCNHAFRLSEYLPSLASGQPPSCPECTNLELARKLVGKRPRGIGRLRPSVVLYNEAHKDGEGVGEVVQKDLMGGKGKSGADLLLVVGTSLKVPGTKRMVREFSKAVKARTMSSPSKVETGSTTYALRSSRSGGIATPTASPRRTPTADEDVQLPKSIYLNLDFPVPTREWEGVFDVWIQGDAQLFAEVLQAEIDKEARAKEMASERKKRKDGEAVASSSSSSVLDELPDLGRTQNAKSSPKRKSGHESEQRHIQTHSPSKSSFKKRRVVVELQTPRYTPPSSERIPSSHYWPDSAGSAAVEHEKLTIRLPPINCSPPHVIPLKTDKKAKKIRHLARPVQPPPPCLSAHAPLRSCHQESQLRPSATQFRDGKDGDFDLNDGPLPHSTLNLMDIAVG